MRTLSPERRWRLPETERGTGSYAPFDGAALQLIDPHHVYQNLVQQMVFPKKERITYSG